MTIATRNHFIRAATIVSFVLAAISVIGTIFILAHHGLPATEPGRRPIDALSGFFLTRWNPVATVAAIGIFPILSLAGLLYVLFAFEKTQTVEITFFAAAIFVLSLESLRIFVPLYGLWVHANFFSAAISRAVIFCRIFVLLALLASAIFTTGETIQQVGPSLFLLAFFSLSLANVMPINSGGMTSTFMIPTGFRGSLVSLLSLLGVLTLVSYLVLGKTRGIPEYGDSAGGIFLFLVGYALLALCDSWLFFAAGALLISVGSWVYLDRIHRYYLWQ
jgi:hypothetical protein